MPQIDRTIVFNVIINITIVIIVIINIVHLLGRGGGCSGFQVTGIIKWGQKSKPKIIPKAFNKTPKTFPEQRLTPQKSHAEFPSLNNFQKALL